MPEYFLKMSYRFKQGKWKGWSVSAVALYDLKYLLALKYDHGVEYPGILETILYHKLIKWERKRPWA